MRAGRYREGEERFQRGKSSAEKFEDPWSVASFEFLQASSDLDRGQLAAVPQLVGRLDETNERLPAPRLREWRVLSTGLAAVESR